MVQSLVNCTRCSVIYAQSTAFRSIFIHFYSHGTKNFDGTLFEFKTETNKLSGEIPTLPEPPTTCCMSGCANCVWIQYAENLTKLFDDGGDKVMKHILDSVTDSNMRAFLGMELRNLKLKK